MNSHKDRSNKTKAQGMVEFALVLPILLLIILGIIESGRLLFIYTSVTTASREAVRYGSAVGDNGMGTPKYLDCDGIRQVAQNMGFLLPIDTIDIIYTRNGSTIADCDTTDSTYPLPSASKTLNGDRIEISTTSHYSLMVPLVSLPSFPITTSSKRTIFTGIAIDATPGPAPPPPAMTFSMSADVTTYSYAGDIITYTFRLENTGGVDFANYEITDSEDYTICSGGTLAQGVTIQCVETYTIVQSDVNGQVDVVKNATASASYLTANATNTVTFLADPQLSLLSITPNPAASTTLNDAIIYTYELKNTGNVNLSSLSINDDIATFDSCLLTTLSNDPADTDNTTTCTGTYHLTQDDLDNVDGFVTNTATATGTYGATLVTSNEVSAIVITRLLVLSMTDPLPYDVAGEEIIYTYQLQNIADVALSNFSMINDPGIICGTNDDPLSSISLPSGGTIECTSSYTVTQDNMDSGSITTETIISAFAGSDEISSNTKEVIIYAIQNPDLSLVITDPANETNISTTPDLTEITYTYRLTNIGDVTLTQPFTILNSNDEEVCTVDTDLAPGDNVDCTYTYPIKDPDDWDAGSITQTVHADTDFIDASGDTVDVHSNEATVIVYTYDGDRITLEITSDVEEIPVSIGDNISFTYVLKNTGSTVLDDAYTLTSSLTDADGCPTITYPTSPGDTIMTCSNVPYTVASADVDAPGDKITNTVNAEAHNGAGDSVTTSDTISNNLSPCAISSSNPTVDQDQDLLEWTLTNIGATVTFTDITITWPGKNAQGPTLTDITLGGTSIWSGTVDPIEYGSGANKYYEGTHTVSSSSLGELSPQDASKQLQFTFDADLENGDYVLNINYKNGSTSCTPTPSLSTTYTYTP